MFAFESNIEHLTSDIAASAALILPSTLLLAPKAADRVFDSQLRKGAWLQRSFTLSTTCHAVASREGGSTIHLYESGDIHRQQISVAAAAEAFSEWSDLVRLAGKAAREGRAGDERHGGEAARVCGRAQRELLRYKADHAAFFFTTAFLLDVTSGNSTIRAGASAVPF